MKIGTPLVFFGFNFIFNTFSSVYGDVTKYASYEDSNGIRLHQRIAPFTIYDTRSKAEIEQNISYKKIIITGCVEFPGIYLVKQSISNRDLFKLANVLDHAPVSTSMVPKIYSTDCNERKISNDKIEDFLNSFPVDGETYIFPAHVL